MLASTIFGTALRADDMKAGQQSQPCGSPAKRDDSRTIARLPRPDLDLVMMTTAARYGQPKEGLAAMDILANIIIPAVRDAH